MGRKILLVTTDQQRFDTLACNGGTLSRTPVVDGLAADGVRYDRAHPQSVVCMPSRSTILTGQHPSTHGVFMNGVPLPAGRPLGRRGPAARRATAPPWSARRTSSPTSTRSSASRRTSCRPRAPRPTAGRAGFEHLETASHGAMGPLHYAQWLLHNHPEALGMYCRAIDDYLQVSAEAGRRHRRAPGQGQPHRPRDLPHRLGGRPDDRLARLARRRRRLVLLDELPRPPPPVGPAGVRGGPGRLARGAAPGGLPRGPGHPGGDHRRQAAALAGLVRRVAGLQLRGAGRLGAGHPDGRPGPRGQRPQRRRGRAHRRGPRPGPGPGGRAGLGRRRGRGVHHRPRRAPGRLRPAVQGPVPRGRA